MARKIVSTICVLPYIEVDEPITIGNVIFEPKKRSENHFFQIFYDNKGKPIENLTTASLIKEAKNKDLYKEIEKSVNVLSYIFDIARYRGIQTAMFLSHDNFQFEILQQTSETPDDNAHLRRDYRTGWESVIITKHQEFAPHYIKQAKISYSGIRKSGNISTIFVLLSDMLKNEENDYIFTALKWFNKANTYSSYLSPSEAIIDNSIALEALLKTPNNGITDTLVYATKMLVKDDDRLGELVRQFYKKRSEVVHKGTNPELSLVETKESGHRYGSHLDFSYLLFNACLIKQIRLSDVRGYAEFFVEDNYDNLLSIDRDYKTAIEDWLESNKARFKQIKETEVSAYFSKDDSKLEEAFSFQMLLYSINERDKALTAKKCFEAIIDIKEKLLDVLERTKEGIADREKEVYESLVKDLAEIKDETDTSKVRELYTKYVLKSTMYDVVPKGDGDAEYYISFLAQGMPRIEDYISAMEKILNLWEEIHYSS